MDPIGSWTVTQHFKNFHKKNIKWYKHYKKNMSQSEKSVMSPLILTKLFFFLVSQSVRPVKVFFFCLILLKRLNQYFSEPCFTFMSVIMHLKQFSSYSFLYFQRHGCIFHFILIFPTMKNNSFFKLNYKNVSSFYDSFVVLSSLHWQENVWKLQILA